MAKAYSDDLRRILQAYEQKEGSEGDLARRFRVSLGYGKKIRQQLPRSGKMERIPHQAVRKPKFTEPVRKDIRHWLQQQPDLTLSELQERLRTQVGLQVSVPSLWVVLRKIGLRLKKSHSTGKSGTGRPTGSGGKRSWNSSAPSRRKG